tara:strand:+ start:166 stop:672 length:507 start_codon:yes stop_codon:yes gene_type:complete
MNAEDIEPSSVIEVDYGTPDRPRTVAEMVTAGNYDHYASRIDNEHFPVTGKSVKYFKWKLFSGGCSSKEGIRRIKKSRWKPAEIEHTLVFGAAFPEIQLKHNIVCLGSAILRGDNRGAPCLDGHGDKRGLILAWNSGVWSDDCRFLAVREISATKFWFFKVCRRLKGL